MERPLAFTVFILLTYYVLAQNPISPPGIYIADPSARIWADGKLYIYGSNDESPNYYCSYTHHVLSSADLKTWELTRDVFSSKGSGDDVPYNDNLLYAPDCQYKDGTYYMYYCQPTDDAEGVATSKSPLGPFVNGKKIYTKGYNQIDPCVFVDDDGQAYYMWGQITAKMAKLKPNMTEIDTSTVIDNVVTEKEHFFHEGSYMVKRNGIYYIIYAHIGRSNRPTCLGYATSKSPMGPFKYGGVIIDNNNCDPKNWNNHGSIVEFNGNWYVFYHRATHNSNTMRKACIEPITFNVDGTINEVEMTSQGVGKPLSATSRIEAERACLLFGNTYIDLLSATEEKLSNMKAEDYAAFKYIDFAPGKKTVEVRVKPGKMAGVIRFAADEPGNAPFALINVPAASNDNEWISIWAEVNGPLEGVHAIWLRYAAYNDSMIDIDWFQFAEKQ